MARIPRKTAVVFGSGLLAQAGGIAEFGTLAQGAPAFNTDIAVIQAQTAWLQGWTAALVNLFPAQEDMNAVDLVHSQQIANILQDGLALWDAETTYYQYSMCNYQGVIYVSNADNNLNNTPSNISTHWTSLSTLTFNGGTATQTGSAYTVAITGFPTNANIAAGTIVTFQTQGIVNPQVSAIASTFAVNGQAALAICDAQGVPIQTGQIEANSFNVLFYNKSITAWIVLNPQPKKSWKMIADVSGSSPSFACVGLNSSSFSLTGTGGSLSATQPAGALGQVVSSPQINLAVTNTTGHEALYTTANPAYPVYANMKLRFHGMGLVCTAASQAFAGLASGQPILTGSDPLANLTGFGFWYQYSGGNVNLYGVHNNGGANSVIVPFPFVVAAFATYDTVWEIVITGGQLTYFLDAINNFAEGFTSNTQVPAANPPTLTLQPYLYAHTLANSAITFGICEFGGDIGN